MFARSALLLFFLPTLASAEKRVAVVGVAAPPNMVGLGSQMTHQILKTASGQKLKVAAPEALLTQLGEPRLSAALQCGADAGCLVDQLQGVAADRAVLGHLTRDEHNYLVKLWLVDLTRSSIVADVDRVIPIASRRLVSDISAALPGLLRGEQEAKGKVRLFANAKGVAIFVDGEPVGKTPILLSLRPGKHLVRAEKSAYMAVQRYVTVQIQQITEEHLRLVRVPGMADPDEEQAPTSPASSRRSSSSLREWPLQKKPGMDVAAAPRSE